jgi:hypothetical protein
MDPIATPKPVSESTKGLIITSGEATATNKREKKVNKGRKGAKRAR